MSINVWNEMKRKHTEYKKYDRILRCVASGLISCQLLYYLLICIVWHVAALVLMHDNKSIVKVKKKKKDKDTHFFFQK